MTNADDFVNGQLDRSGTMLWVTNGLTKREYFAAMILQGIMASDSGWCRDKSASNHAVWQADNLIEELNK